MEPIPEPLAYWSFDAPTATTTSLTATFGGYQGDVAGALLDPGGIVGEALSFDGLNDHVTIPSFPDLSGPSTVVAWMYLREAPDTENPLFLSRWQHLQGERQFFLGTKNGSFAAGVSRDGSDVEMIMAIDRSPVSGSLLDQWVHLAYVFDGQTITLYRNGSAVGRDSFGEPTSLHSPGPAHPVRMGRSYNPAPDSVLHGMMDEMAVWEDELSAGQIEEMVLQGRDGIPLVE